MRARSVRKLTFAAVAVAAGLSLTACNGDDMAQGGAPSESSASSASSTGGGTDPTGKGGDAAAQGTAGGSGSDAGTEADKCRTDDLDITALDATIDGDTEGTVAVTFKNRGDQGCVLSGYAGVDLKTSEGDLSAQRSGQESTPMTLEGGKSVSFGVTYPINDSGGSGVKVNSLVVTPPDETKSFSLQWPGGASLPVTDGTGSAVKVGPMGSAGQGGES
ncbi:DUF4232 domain-containing protein [Streptomyces sp. NPDC002795]|uniref:DUF4232 domain-containing protein n=1 Tax=Streptomyces sp. NPDC002795 TaxID=3364665 RepID=UPI00369DA68F